MRITAIRLQETGTTITDSWARFVTVMRKEILDSSEILDWILNSKFCNSMHRRNQWCKGLWNKLKITCHPRCSSTSSESVLFRAFTDYTVLITGSTKYVSELCPSVFLYSQSSSFLVTNYILPCWSETFEHSYISSLTKIGKLVVYYLIKI